MEPTETTSTGSVGPGTGRGRRWAIGALRTVAWLLLMVGVWAVPLAFVWYVMPHGADSGVDPWWPWLVAEVVIATLGVSMTTWWVADWLDEPGGIDDPVATRRPDHIRRQ